MELLAIALLITLWVLEDSIKDFLKAAKESKEAEAAYYKAKKEKLNSN